MIWPHDRTGLSLISPDLNPNRATRKKRVKRDIDLSGFVGCFVEPIRSWEEDRWNKDWAAMERSVGGRTPVVALRVKVIVTKL